MSWTAETLLSDTAWIRSLARRLVADGAAADDLVQEAWVAALDRPERPSRDWLAAVLRRLSFTRRRAEARREEREQRAARLERGSGQGEPDAAAGLARVEAQRSLADALLVLDEPFRSALVWRYAEGLAPGEIAARAGVPLGTVHSRLHRGLERMRAELERRHGACDGVAYERNWLAALAPLVELRHAAPPTAAASASWGLHAAAAGVGLALLVGFAATRGGVTPLTRTRATSQHVAATPQRPVGETVSEAAVASVVPPVVADIVRSEVPDGGAQVEAGTWSLGLTVLGPDGAPVAGAGVLLALSTAQVLESLPLGSTDVAGRLERPLELLDANAWATLKLGSASLIISSGDLANLEVPLELDELEGPDHFEVTVTLKDTPGLTGRVVDESGQPVSGAMCRLVVVDGGEKQYVGFALSAVDGSFVLTASDGRGYALAETLDGCVTTGMFDASVPHDLGVLRIPELATLVGVVTDPDGHPARGVTVTVRARGDAASARRADGSPSPGLRFWQGATDANGRFSVSGLRFGDYQVIADPGGDGEGDRIQVSLPCTPIELELVHPRLLVRVVDVEGRTVRGIDVNIAPLDGRGEVAGEREYTFSWGELGIATASVVRGGTYSVLVTDSDTHATREVRIPERGYEHGIEIEFGGEVERGDLYLHVTDPSGARIGDLEVGLRSAPTGDLIEGLCDLVPDREGWLRGLPAGRYIAVVRLPYVLSRDRLLWLDGAPFEIEIGSDAPFRVEREALPGARLALDFGVTQWPAGARSRGASGLVVARDFHVAAWLTPSGEPAADPAPAGRKLMWPTPRGLRADWVPGERAEHWRVEAPGRYTLVVSGDAWEELETEVVLAAGEWTTARVMLSPSE